LAAAPVVALVIVFVFLRNWSDPVYVAGHIDYELLFLAGAAAWAFVSTSALGWIGVSWIDDAVDRGNPAAVIAVIGAMGGTAMAYAYSNIGNGPTIWTTIVPAAVATAAMLALWAMLEAIGDPAEAITVDRDVAAGIRAAGFFVAAGLVLGRAMAGDWFSWPDTFAEFVSMAWVAVLVAGLAGIFNQMFRPTPSRPEPSRVGLGVVPACILVLIAVTYLIYLGPPEVAPPGQYPLGEEPAVEME
jgi:uncharacterized membrane protein YjfL (UPF0719 family)